MKRILSMVVLVCALVGASCAFAGDKEKSPPYDKTISDAQALDIAEATFRYQFEHNASGQQQNSPAYYLSLFGKDPTPEFLARFKNNKPPVRKGSDFKVGAGVKFLVEGIKRVSDTKVEVSGGYDEAALSASGNTYLVELKDGKWVVTGDTMHWIS